MLSVLDFVPLLLCQSLLVFLTVTFIVFLQNRHGVANYQGKTCRLAEGERTFLCTFFGVPVIYQI